MNRWRYRLRKLLDHPRPARFVAARLLWHSGLSRFLVFELPRGFRVRFYPSSISAALWADPRARTDDEDFVWAILRPGDRYIDAGANIGQLALAAAKRVGPKGQVIAIEPHPRIFRYLLGNIELNAMSVVEPVECALGDQAGETSFTDRRSDDQNYVQTKGELRVPVRTLDEVIAPRPTRLLKLDVEGYELAVLRGAARTLELTDVIYCELSSGNCRRFGYRPQDVEEFLLERGFRLLTQLGGDSLRGTQRPYFSKLEEASLPATGYNLIAARPQVVDEVTALLARDA